MMETPHLLLVILAFLSSSLQVNCDVPDGNLGLEELFSMCVNESRVEFSCKDRCGPSIPYSRCCQCDSECLSLGDCCLDYEHFCFLPPNHHHRARWVPPIPPVPDPWQFSSVSHDEEGDQTRLPDDEFLTDDFMVPPSVIGSYYPDFDMALRRSHRSEAKACVHVGFNRYFRLEKRCTDPSYIGSQLEEMCKMTEDWDFLSSLPVAVTNDTHYRNIYCAFCSGKQYKDIYLWNIAFDCETDIGDAHLHRGDLLNTIDVLMKLCEYDIVPTLAPGTQLPRSCMQFDNECMQHGGSTQSTCHQLCDTYTYPILVNGNWYKNVHSAYCGDEFLGKSINITCSFENAIPDYNIRPLSLPLLFMFSAKDGALLNNKGQELSTTHNSLFCGTNEWFDPFLRECRIIHCPGNSLVIDGVCVNDVNKSSSFEQCSTNNSFWKQKWSQQSIKNRSRSALLKVRAVSDHQSALNLIMVTFRVTLSSEKLNVEIQSLKSVSSSTRNSSHQIYDVAFELQPTDDTSDYTSMPSAIRRAMRLLVYDSELTMSVLSIEWQTYDSLDIYSDACKESHGDLFLMVLWAKDTTYYMDDQYDELFLNVNMFDQFIPRKLTIFSQNDKEWSRFDFQCCNSPLLCKQITFNSSEFDWENSVNGSLLHKASGIVISPDAFSLDGNRFVRVCKSIFDNETTTGNQIKDYSLDSQTYLTLIGNAISIISLLATLVTVCTFAKLRNLPGKIISCLSVSLLLANILLLVSFPTSSEWLCLLFGVSLHYAWLSVFFWANVLAVDLTRTFRVNSKRMVFRIKGNVQFIFYSMYAWLSPAVIVTIGLLVHFLIGRNIYSITGTCWLLPGQPIIYLFLTPFTFFMVVNTALFIVIMVSISKTKNEMDNVAESAINIQTRALSWLAVKLSFTLGITWTLGLVAALTDTPITWYIFNVVNSFSGLGVSVSIMGNGNVWKLWRAKIKCCSRTDVEGAKERKSVNLEKAASECRVSSATSGEQKTSGKQKTILNSEI
ncbi:uncharacterized protein LOC129277321 [Lytechinus pictus]|uniref:uncharacterized protein LOC129277321 n=1 Tax=Lytechinus pictus TaxID=7653 RepID=UPI0030B9AE60